jgi:hypothetical protein
MMEGLITQCEYCQKFVLVYGFIMQILYVMYIGVVGILHHDVGIAMGIPSHNINFKGTV